MSSNSSSPPSDGLGMAGLFLSSPYQTGDIALSVTSLAIFVLYNIYFLIEVVFKPERTNLGKNLQIRRAWVCPPDRIPASSDQHAGDYYDERYRRTYIIHSESAQLAHDLNLLLHHLRTLIPSFFAFCVQEHMQAIF